MVQQNPMFYQSKICEDKFSNDTTLINGEQFFDYVQYYAEIYEKLFKEGIGLVDKVKKLTVRSRKGVKYFFSIIKIIAIE